MIKTERTHLTPRLVSESLGVGIEPVLSWIHSGQLRASNVSNSPIRPRWRISKDDLKAFLDHRCNQQRGHDKPPAKRRPRRQYV